MTSQLRVFPVLFVGVLVLGGADCLGPTPTDECTPNLSLVCDGNDVVERNDCDDTESASETCPAACHLGRCVDCAPGAGKVCDGDDVRTLDTCGALGDVVETCAAGSCRAGACIDASCTPDAETVCVGDSVYSVDSCANIEDFVQRCDAENPCVDGACSGCTPDMFIACYDGDVYLLDSCGELGQVNEDCGAGSCVAAPSVQCDAAAPVCTPNDAITCFEGDIHWADSCGGVQLEIQEACDNGCENGVGCLACEQIPAGTTCDGNEQRQLLAGCGLSPTEGDAIMTCADGCFQGECLDPAACVPDAGSVCDGGDVHAVDSCGVVGAVIETCAGGCANAACEGVDAGPTGNEFACVCGEGGCSAVYGDTSYACDGCFNPGGDFPECLNAQVCLPVCAADLIYSCGDGYAVTGPFESTVPCEGAEGEAICAECPAA